MKDFVKSFLSDRHPLRILYHRVMAVLAAIVFRFPANEMTVIAVTGTNGKTTTCNLIHQIFTEAGKCTGMITTVNFKIVNEERANEFKQTTLSPFLMQRLLRDMVRARCEVAVIEVTSHAMIQSRMWGINVDTAVFTNLSHDHLDYHGTMEEYKAAKGRLFSELNTAKRKAGVPKMTVINQDDAEQEYFARFPADHQFMFGIQKGTYNARNLEARPDGTTFGIRIPNGEEVVNFKIPGRMNVYNALAAATVGVAHHIALPTIKTALEKMQAVPGRLETINEGQPYTVVVDYAHAADALEQLLTLFREVTSGKLYLVFGATGDRDKSKRPRMGEIADKYADFIVLTNDDPYTEDPKSIAQMVRVGIHRNEGDRFWQVLNRREAIRLALSLAEKGDAVLVAGKGAELYQVVGKDKIPHDDRQVVRELLARSIDIELPK